MTVQFDKIGPGQVGRFVYQVIGRNGPIFNPQNIRYLAPDDPSLPALPTAPPGTGVSELAAGLAGVNLLLSLGSVVLSAMTLQKVKEVSAKCDSMISMQFLALAQLESISVKLDQISVQLNRIESKVSQINLRAALAHIGKTCFADDTVDLMQIRKLADDVQDFLGSIEGYGYYSGTFFRLSTDLREQLTALNSFLFNLRREIARRHNVEANGDPLRVLTMHPMRDYEPSVRPEFSSVSLNADFGTKFDSVFPSAPGIERESHKMRGACVGVGIGRGVTERKISKKIESTYFTDSVGRAEFKKMYWLMETDMGLMWRLQKELRAVGDYQQEFAHWQGIESKPLDSDKILIDCSLQSSFEG